MPQLNLLGKLFFGALAASVVKSVYEHHQVDGVVERLRPLARSGDWIGYNQAVDDIERGATYEDRCQLWLKLRS